MSDKKRVKSVAVIGAGAAGAITAAALKAEDYFENIRVFERRETAGGTWIYDADPRPNISIEPGKLAPDIDRPLRIPETLPQVTPPSHQERFAKTPIYASLTTNVPSIAMSFSDVQFPYGPFVPHHVARQYVESYFSTHKTDSSVVLNTTVEDLARVPSTSAEDAEEWKLVLRRYDAARQVDVWWEERFDAVILANGHYAVPFVPKVKGLEDYVEKYPGRVIHSKSYRTPDVFSSKKVVIVGNSASGHDVMADLLSSARHPVYWSIRSKTRWDGDKPPPGAEWKPTIKEYEASGRIIFDDDTFVDDVDTVIYCTGYQPSFPFWNEEANGRPLWDYASGKIGKGYWHTFFQDFPTLGIVGLPRVLSFRSYEYQAIALARIFAGRNAQSLPPIEEQAKWEKDRLVQVKINRTKFHDIPWESGETIGWLDKMFAIAGLGTLKGDGRVPPVLGKELIWAVEHIRKYPDPKEKTQSTEEKADGLTDWVMVDGVKKDKLAFI